MHLTIIPRYAALLGLLYSLMTLRIIRYRRRHQIALGDGGDSELQRLRAAHSNFAEYTPFILVLLILLELQGWPGWSLHALGASLTIGRLAHSQSLPGRIFAFRLIGMVLTLSSLIGASIMLLTGP